MSAWEGQSNSHGYNDNSKTRTFYRLSAWNVRVFPVDNSSQPVDNSVDNFWYAPNDDNNTYGVHYQAVSMRKRMLLRIDMDMSSYSA